MSEFSSYVCFDTDPSDVKPIARALAVLSPTESVNAFRRLVRELLGAVS